MNKLPLLMTASVSTRGMKGACFTDAERERMYVDALTFYIDTLLAKDEQQVIVFAENSGWDCSSIQQQLPGYQKGRIEFISLDPKSFDISKGKGYNEMLMINQAVARSQLIKDAGAFFKVTGRYPIHNVGYFISAANTFLNQKGGDLYCDIKDHKLYDWLRLGWNGHSFDCRLFGVRRDWYIQNLSSVHTLCDDYNGNLLETVLYKYVKNMGGGAKIVTRFRREPHFGGLEGSQISAISFTKDQDSFKGKVKRFAGNFIRTFMPWFKF